MIDLHKPLMDTLNWGDVEQVLKKETYLIEGTFKFGLWQLVNVVYTVMWNGNLTIIEMGKSKMSMCRRCNPEARSYQWSRRSGWFPHFTLVGSTLSRWQRGIWDWSVTHWGVISSKAKRFGKRNGCHGWHELKKRKTEKESRLILRHQYLKETLTEN